MLTFLRKIRKSLINTGSTQTPTSLVSRYLLYAIGEIVLVVIGILIALQINNWNEQRKRNTATKVHLSNLLSDLQDDKATLEIIKSMNLFRDGSLQYLLNLAGALDPKDILVDLPQFEGNLVWQDKIPTQYNRDFIDLAFLWSIRIHNQNANQSTIDEIRTNGIYASIKNQELKDEINKYYLGWKWRLAVAMNDLNEEWEKSLETDGILTSNVSSLEDPILLIKDHPIRIARIKRLIRESRFWVSSALILIQDAQELTEMLEIEIATY